MKGAKVAKPEPPARALLPPPSAGHIPAHVGDVLRSGGNPLHPSTRALMEPRFGQDFSHVRVHTSDQAAASASALGAQAYTVGRDIVFAANAFTPHTNQGRELIAHELAHTIQQRDTYGQAPSSADAGGGESDARADIAARSAANGETVSVSLPTCGPMIQLKPATDQRWRKDVRAARYRGQLMATRIRTHGLLSKDARAKMNEELAYFQDDAKDAYLREVKPALAQNVEIEMPQVHGRRVPKVPRIEVLPDRPAYPGQFSDEEVYKPIREQEERDEQQRGAEREAEIDKLQRMMAADKWPREYRDFAVGLLTSVLNEAGRANIDPRAISDRIREPIIARYRKWLEQEDERRKKLCERMPGGAMGFILKSQAGFHPTLDPCRRWFADEYSHGPSELEDLARGLRLNRQGTSSWSPTPAEYIYYDVFELRRKLDPLLLQQEEMAGEMLSGVTGLTGVKAPAAQVDVAATRSASAEVASAEAKATTTTAGGGTPPSTTIKASPPPPPVQVRRPGAPTPVTDVEVVKANVSAPSTVKPQQPSAHQTDWTARGGPDLAPPAYRDADGNVHVSTDHPLLGTPGRGGIPPVRAGAQTPKAPTPPPKSPSVTPAPSAPSSDIGHADTGKAPDPMAKTPAAPPPKQPPAPAPAVSPKAETGAAAAESRRAQAPRGHIAPPQPVSAEVVERIRNAPRVTDPKRKGSGSNVNYSADHEAHEEAWRRLGGHGDSSPPAFIYDNQVYLDPSRWPPSTP